jgi:hypothetical protein
MKYLNYSLTILLAFVFLASCGSNKKKEQKTSEAFNIEDYITAAETIDPTVNSVDQVFDILGMVNAEYYDILTNDPYNAHSYKTTFPIAAANLGIYMVDILYHFYGEETESMYLAFSAAQELAKHVGVDEKLGLWTMEKLEGSTMQRDTITRIFNQLLEESEQYGSEKEMIFIHTAFLTGSFVEKVHITGSLLKNKMEVEELSHEDEGDIRELLVIFMNQLNPSASVLYEAFVKQQEQLEGLVVLTTFEQLKDLSDHLIELKPTLAVAPVSEIASNKELKTAFELIEKLRSILVTA